MFAILLAPVYLALNLYFLFRLLIWLGMMSEKTKKLYIRIPVIVIFSFFSLAMIVGFFLPKASSAKRNMVMIGNYWYGVCLYTAMVLLTADIARLGILFMERRKKTGPFRIRTKKIHVLIGTLCVAVIAATTIFGVIHAGVIHTADYAFTVDKKAGKMEKLHIVLVADLHMGYNIGCDHIQRMVEKINAQDPDLVVIAGDIFDNDYDSLEDPERLIHILKGIKSRYGIYACYGNHDVAEKIIGGFTFESVGSEKKQSDARMDELLQKAGITLLMDESVLINDSFYLYGRPDAEKPGRGVKVRKTPEEIMKGLDTEKPVIVLDHEPRELDELAKAGVDVDLCGHTHDGQIFPLNLTCRLIWENSYGYMKKGRMHNVVTSGVGLYGPFMRVGTDAEIVNISILFQSFKDAEPEQTENHR